MVTVAVVSHIIFRLIHLNLAKFALIGVLFWQVNICGTHLV